MIQFTLRCRRPREWRVLAALGLLTIVALLALIMSGRLSPLVALIVVPTTAALVGGFGLDTAKFIVTGLQQTASVAAMFVFAILYFGVMTDAGMLDPIVDRILRAVGMHPTRIVVGSALLALLVHLDGSGAVTFLVTIPAMLPLFERLGMDKRILACVVSMAAGVNFLPWTGPTLRASAALHISTTEIFRPLIPVQLVGLAVVFGSGLHARQARGTTARTVVGHGAAPIRPSADARSAGDAPARTILDQPRADGRRHGRDDCGRRRSCGHVHARHRGGADDQLSDLGAAARPRRRPRQGGVDDGRHPARRRGVYRHLEGHRHAGRHGRRSSRRRSCVAWRRTCRSCSA